MRSAACVDFRCCVAGVFKKFELFWKFVWIPGVGVSRKQNNKIKSSNHFEHPKPPPTNSLRRTCLHGVRTCVVHISAASPKIESVGVLLAKARSRCPADRETVTPLNRLIYIRNRVFFSLSLPNLSSTWFAWLLLFEVLGLVGETSWIWSCRLTNCKNTFFPFSWRYVRVKNLNMYSTIRKSWKNSINIFFVALFLIVELSMTPK